MNTINTNETAKIETTKIETIRQQINELFVASKFKLENRSLVNSLIDSIIIEVKLANKTARSKTEVETRIDDEGVTTYKCRYTEQFYRKEDLQSGKDNISKEGLSVYALYSQPNELIVSLKEKLTGFMAGIEVNGETEYLTGQEMKLFKPAIMELSTLQEYILESRLSNADELYSSANLQLIHNAKRNEKKGVADKISYTLIEDKLNNVKAFKKAIDTFIANFS